MVFLDPRNDIAFKKLFGNETHKEVVISFLNSVLGNTGDHIITSVVFNDPHNVPETIDSKESIVDVKCTDQLGRQFLVEMQVLKKVDYGLRAQYYTAKAIGRQLGKSAKYETLLPVIFVGVLDFNLIDNPNFISHHRILDIETHKCSLSLSEYHFIELSKFNKEITPSSDYLDKWVYFLKYADDLEAIPAALKTPVIQEAFAILEEGSWSVKDLEAYDRELDKLRMRYDEIKTAREEGVLAGEQKAKIELAKKLLDYLDCATIANTTGLSLEEIQNLIKQ